MHTILDIIEYNSRLNLCTTALKKKGSINILIMLILAIRKYGKPVAVRTDNESIFTSRLFEAVLRLLNIKHQLINIAQPWQNGRIERYFGTLKEKLDQWQVECSQQLDKSLVQFRFWYNHVRPHQHLDGKTPAEVWNSIDVFSNGFKKKFWFDAWDGLLTGYYLR